MEIKDRRTSGEGWEERRRGGEEGRGWNRSLGRAGTRGDEGKGEENKGESTDGERPGFVVKTPSGFI